MPTQVASLFVTLDLKDNATSGLQKFDGILQSMSGRMRTIGSNMSQLGVSMAQLSAPLVAGLSLAVVNATSFDEAMTNAGAVLGRTANEMADLNREILAIGANTRAGPQATAEAFYDIVSGVQDASTHMAILNAAIETSEAGNANLQATTSALVGVMNSYRFAATDATRVSDIFTATVATGVVTMDELASALPNVSGLAASQSISFEELAGSIALITTRGTSASEATTQLKASITALINPNETLKSVFEELGVASGEALIEQYGLIGAMELVANSAVAQQEGLAKVLGSTEALNAALALTADGSEEFMEKFSSSIDGATESAHKIQMESTAAQFDLLKSQVQALSIEVGDALLPALNDMMKAIMPMVRSFADWIRENRKIVPVVAMVAGGVIAIGSALAFAGTMLSAAGGILSAVGAAFTLLLSPIGLLVAGIAALGIAYKTNLLGFGDAVDDIVSSVSNALPNIAKFFSDLARTLLEGDLSGAAKMLSREFRAIGEQVIPALTDGLANLGTWMWDNVIQPLATQAQMYIESGQLVENLKALGQGLVNAVAIGIGLYADFANFIFNNVITPLATQIEAAASAAFESAKVIGTNLMQGIADGIMSMVSSVESMIKSAINSVVPDSVGITISDPTGLLGSRDIRLSIPQPFPTHQVGTHWTGTGPVSQIAGFVHNQEAVIPASGASGAGIKLIPSRSGLLVESNVGNGNVYINIANVNGRSGKELVDELVAEINRRPPSFRKQIVGV